MRAQSLSDLTPPVVELVLGLAPVAENVHVTKVFGSTVADDDVSFGLYPGSVLALVGENGAGKSTRVKTLGGVYRPDDGHITVRGGQVAFTSALGAERAGISVVHQQPGLFPELSLAENVFAGKPLRRRQDCSTTGRCVARRPGSWSRSSACPGDPARLLAADLGSDPRSRAAVPGEVNPYRTVEDWRHGRVIGAPLMAHHTLFEPGRVTHATREWGREIVQH